MEINDPIYSLVHGLQIANIFMSGHDAPRGCKIELMFGELHLMNNCVPICNSNENTTELTKASW